MEANKRPRLIAGVEESEYWSERKRCLVTLGRAREHAGSPAHLLACDQYLFRMFDEVAVEPFFLSRIAVCGGICNHHEETTSRTEVLDIERGEWRAAAELPEPRCHHGLAHVCGRLFIFGGQAKGQMATSTCMVLNESASRWEEIAPMSVARRRMGVAVVGTSVYLIGGLDGKERVHTVEVFDARTRTWANGSGGGGVAVAPMPTTRWDCGIAVIGPLVYVIGGLNGITYNTMEVLDTAKGTWQTLPPMPTARCCTAVATIGRKIWVMGGFDNHRDIDLIEVYDVDRNEWTTSPHRLTTPRLSARAVVIDGKIWLTGGVPSGESRRPLNLVEVFDPETGKWVAGPQTASVITFHASVAY
jgi:kelch-like protein 18